MFHKALAVLGPLPFLFDVNDIQECSDKFFLFADDTNILYADTNLKTFWEEIVNQELRKLCAWFTANKLTLNIN